jgi:hypothetical protein
VPDSNGRDTSLDKELESLREADEKLTAQISRASFLRLVMVFLLMLLFVKGISQERDTADVTDLIARIQTIEGQTAQPKALDPITCLFGAPEWPDSNGDSNVKTLNDLGRQLYTKYNQIFQIKLSALGTETNVDLRILVVTLPVWLAFAYIYIRLLRYKHQALLAICGWHSQRIAADEISSLNRLLYTGEPRRNLYRKYPSILVQYAFWGTVLAFWAIILVTWEELKTVEASIFLISFDVVMTGAIYSFVYTRYTGRKLLRQVHETFGRELPADAFTRISQWASVAWKRRPRPSLVVGSLLVLVTLFLNTAQLSCGRAGSSRKGDTKETQAVKTVTPYRPGYELILNRADWPTAIGWLFSSLTPFENSIGRWMYSIAELLATAALGSIVAYRMRWKWIGPTVQLLSSVSMVVSLYLITNYASKHLLGLWNMWLVVWISTSLIWIAGYHPASRNRIRWLHRARAVLPVIYLPVVLASATYMGETLTRLPGLSVLYFGAHAMTVGYLSLRLAPDFKEESAGAG